MPTPSKFPHLRITFRGKFEPTFGGNWEPSAEVKQIRADPKQHVEKLRKVLTRIREEDAVIRRERVEQSLPPIPADKGFLVKLPEGVDIEVITKALGVELVAETEEGFILMSSKDIAFEKFEQVMSEFESGSGSIVAGSAILDIYDSPNDNTRLENILAPEILEEWPLDDEKVYMFDIGIQTALSTRTIKWPAVKQRRDEDESDFLDRRAKARQEVIIKADEAWLKTAEVRVEEMVEFVKHYEGEIITEMMSDPAKEDEEGMIFPDSVQVRIKMSGVGFRDVILNFAHIFDVAPLPVVERPRESDLTDGESSKIELLSPTAGAPAVCVIDSGIQEEHYWLQQAIDSDSSRCFVPGIDPEDVADHFPPKGHGTRVAGAVLYPRDIPKTGIIEPVAWIQNARVLDDTNRLRARLSPADYLTAVVQHFQATPFRTKIYNHSINARTPCPRRRMTAWAAKIDQLSHQRSVLFIQSCGNQDRLGYGNESNPGLQSHLDDGRVPPDHLLEASMRIADPAQSLHALTVGSIAPYIYESIDSKSFASIELKPSGFSRGGYSQPWYIVKPEVVELGGDLIHAKDHPKLVRFCPDTSIELLNSTIHDAPAHSKDGVGTSFTAPKVAHLAAQLQRLFPESSPLLYRALIVQSARWPAWTQNAANADEILRTIGYGLPSADRAVQNGETRITLITPHAKSIGGKEFHLYTIRVPDEIRNAAVDAKVRIDITLAYTALPRWTRARRTGYLETWLDWDTSKIEEPIDVFLARMQNGGGSPYRGIPWTLHTRSDLGASQETSRSRGSVQKDWAIVDCFELPEEFGIAIRGHIGWNHLEGAGIAQYCLVVTFESVDVEVPIYSLVESQIEAEQEILT